MESFDCEFEGLKLHDGQSACPCELCDEVIFCDDGLVSAAECLPGFSCLPTASDQADCFCNDSADAFCPWDDACPDDPDC